MRRAAVFDDRSYGVRQNGAVVTISIDSLGQSWIGLANRRGGVTLSDFAVSIVVPFDDRGHVVSLASLVRVFRPVFIVDGRCSVRGFKSVGGHHVLAVFKLL